MIPFFPPAFHQLSNELSLIGPVIATIDSVGLHIHTIPVSDNTKNNQY
jgi:hypothetical protein